MGADQSVFEQTHDNLELIVVDDCSSDRTYELVDGLKKTGFARRFVRFETSRNQRNIGAHGTINHAIAKTRGSHICILNSDDRFRPKRVELLLSRMKETGAQLAFSGVELFGEMSGPLPPELKLLALQQRLKIEREPTIGFALLGSNVAISTGNLLFTSEIWLQAGPFQPPKILP